MSGAGSSIPLEPYHDVEEKDHLLNTTEDDDGLNEFTIEDAPRRQEFVNIQSRGHSVVTCAVFLMACLRDAIPPFSITGILWFLVPSFLSGSNPPKKPLHPTAYLDGMRGVAAFTVLIYHLSYTPWFTELGWGTQGKNHEFWRLPIIRLVYSGSMGVSLFFLISGYALSYRPLKLLRSGKTLEGHQALASTLLRRWARLFLPTAVSTFIVFWLIRFGAYEPLRHIINQKKYFRYHIEMMPMRHKTFWEQFFHWMGQQRKIWNPIAIRGEGIVYDTHLWTIAYEFRNSLYVFLTILGTSRLQTRYRITLVSLINLYLWSFARWDLVLFLTGMILAEWDLIRGAHLPPSALPLHRSATQRRSWKMVAFWTAASLVSLFLMSVPDEKCLYAPGYRTLCRLATWKGSQNRWWHAISATLWAITVSRVPFWKRFYESDIVQYLGRISYAMYLVHGMTYKSFGLNLEYWMWKNVTGTQGANRFLGFMLAACVTIPFCIWWADIFWRLVDIPAVRFTKWLEGKVTKKD